MRKRFGSYAWLFALVAVAAAQPASADYLYDIWNGQEGVQPYAMVILDTSESMDEDDERGDRTCPYGFIDHDKDGKRDSTCISRNRNGDCVERREPCLQRIDAAKASLQRTLPRIANDVGLGLMIFAGGTGSTKETTNTRDSCRVKTIAAPPADYSTIEAAVDQAQANMWTPLKWSLVEAHRELKAIRGGDNAGCRDYYVVLVTDGDDTCGGASGVENQIKKMREDGIRTFVIGFGRVSDEVQSNASIFARAGGTAVNDKGEYVCWNDATCGGATDARAMFAYDSHELDRMMQASFDEVRRGIFSAADPVIASVPQKRSEIDRVSRNFMVYSSFEMRGEELRGHLFGIRLYEEDGDYSGDWEFTDLSDPEQVLASCGPDKTCVFDAGQRLVGRTDRKIYTGLPGTPITDEGGFSIPVDRAIELEDSTSGRSALAEVWKDFSALAPIEAALADEELPFQDPSNQRRIPNEQLRTPSNELYEDVIRWLHGKDRNWPLGDIYHASPAITEPPAYGYRDRGYPQFRLQNQNRPWMIYVGANDGMIHAFYASPDLEQPDEPRWQPGDEAWAYLPMNMIGRTLSEVHAGSQRFFSQDLSCRYTDLILDDKVNDKGVLDCGDDPNCGWATVLLCGQGWGGSWYVAIDVTNPKEPRPLWEMTVPEAAGYDGDKRSHQVGLGRTWSVPAINLLNYKGKPTWMALFGNGYNADMADCPVWKANNGTCEGSKRRASYRMLNLPFDGAWPEYGDGTDGDWGHAYLVDMKDGKLRKLLHMHPDGKQGMQTIMADVASIDSDGNGLIDAAYLGGWDGAMARVPFGDTRTDDLSGLDACTSNDKTLFHLGNSKPITSNPSAVRHPIRKDLVYLFTGSGIDGGRAPDQQRNQGNQWEFSAFHFIEEGKSTCVETPNNSTNLCSNQDWKLNDKARLLGQPLFSRQNDGSEWVLYTTWTPPAGSCGAGGEARLYCLDVTHALASTPVCKPCGDMDGDAEHKPDRYAVIDTDGTPPTPPVVADGRVYVGPKATSILDKEGKAQPPNPNTTKTVRISWREVF